MQEKFKELLLKKKKEGKVLSPEQAKSKMDVLQELMGLVDDSMGNKIKGLQKVTVAAPTKEGLEEGLEKAQEVIEGASEESEDEEEGDLSKEDKIAALEAKLAELKK